MMNICRSINLPCFGFVDGGCWVETFEGALLMGTRANPGGIANPEIKRDIGYVSTDTQIHTQTHACTHTDSHPQTRKYTKHTRADKHTDKHID